jgi:FMN phosphatase YigB (HAD superfamily)
MSQHVASGAVAALVWDLDGTLYRGTAACLHYARGIAETLPATRREAYLEAMKRFLAGKGGVDAADGWEAAVVLAGGTRGASRAFGEQFARSRDFMLTDACELTVPPGLRELLERVAGTARRVLVTNTPSYGVMPLLERLELTTLLDEIACDSAKPYRFDVRLGALADVLGIPRRAVLSIGDHYVNDIAPALAAGCATAYVDPFGVGPTGEADLSAAQLEDLLEAIEAWVDEQPAAEPARAVAR